MADTFEQDLEREQLRLQRVRDIAFNGGIEACVSTILYQGGVDSITASHLSGILYALKRSVPLGLDTASDNPKAVSPTTRVRPNPPFISPVATGSVKGGA